MSRLGVKPYKPSEEITAILKNFRLLDDDFMTVFFNQNYGATELMLNIILGRDDIVVKKIEVQKIEKNPINGGRSVILDIFAIDSDGKHYDIEVQRADRGAARERARFHSAVLDSRMLEAGEDFSELRDSYVIFITENDVMGKGLPIYHVNRHIEELDCERFDDGNHILYINGAYKDDLSDIGKLMHDFRCTSAVDMFYPVLKEGMHHYKETDGGKTIMCKAVEDYVNKERKESREKGKIEGKVEGKIEGKIENAKIMIREGKLSLEEIALYSDLPLDKVKELSEEKTE